MNIREANTNDINSIKDVYLKAFDHSEAEVVADLAIKLLNENDPVKTLSLVAIENNDIVGHIAFSPVFLESSNKHFAYILAPLAVAPEFQKISIGSSLVKHGLDRISETGAFIVFVYGDPQYYSRFGFKKELAKKYIPPCTMQYPEGWQALTLGSGDLPDAGKIICVESLNDPILW